jgi:hypothetical protein
VLDQYQLRHVSLAKVVSPNISALSFLHHQISFPVFDFVVVSYHFDVASYISLPNICNSLRIDHSPHLSIMASIVHRLSPKHLTRDLRELGFKKELVRKFVERPDSVEHATILLKSYSPPSRKPRKGRYNNLCLRKNSRNQRKPALETNDYIPSILTHLSLDGL